MRGQVTAFAIIGILALLAIGGLFWISRAEPVDPRVQPTLELETCIEQASIDVIRSVGLAGGVNPDTDALTAEVDTSTVPVDRARVALFAWQPGTNPSVSLNEHHELVPNGHTAYNTLPYFEINIGQPPTTQIIREEIELQASECGEDLTIENVFFSDEQVRIEARSIENGRSPRDITVTLPVPLQAYHRALRSLLLEENTNVSFTIASYAPPGDFTVRLESDVNDDGMDLLVLESDRPVLGGEPFRYTVLIQDRPPLFTGPVTLSCPAAGPAIITGAALVDPDDGNEAEITRCDGASNTYALESAGSEWEVEV